jgi:hypothetical protein
MFYMANFAKDNNTTPQYSTKRRLLGLFPSPAESRAKRLEKDLLKVDKQGYQDALAYSTKGGKLGINSREALKRINTPKGLAMVAGLTPQERRAMLSERKKLNKALGKQDYMDSWK